MFGRIDITVANSGISGGYGTLATTSNDTFARVIATNISGTFYTLRAAANMVENNGRIIIIGTAARHGTNIGMAPYSSSKVAGEVMANTLAQEVGTRGITVNTIAPSATTTGIMITISYHTIAYHCQSCITILMVNDGLMMSMCWSMLWLI